jgi:hypothetical protein
MRLIAVVLMLFFFVACAFPDKQNESLYKVSMEHLTFLGDVQFKSQDRFEGIPLGGLSSLTYNEKDNLLYAISDDRGERGIPRFYKFQFSLEKNNFSVTPKSAHYLMKGVQDNFAVGEVDFEGMDLLNNGDYVISTEGDNKSIPPLDPKVYLFSSKGVLKSELDVPSKFNVQGISGIYNNLAFEGLSLTPDQRHLIVAMEDTLKQDGPSVSFKNGSLVRFLKYGKSGNNYKPVAELIYPLSRVPNWNCSEDFMGGNGVSAILALDENRYLVIERSYSPTLRRNTIRLFMATVMPNSTNVLSLDSVKEREIVPLKKKFIADLDAFLPSFNGKKSLDNIEGISFGPRVDGKRTILLVSDDNFSRHQRTIFLAFAVNFD